MKLLQEGCSDQKKVRIPIKQGFSTYLPKLGLAEYGELLELQNIILSPDF